MLNADVKLTMRMSESDALELLGELERVGIHAVDFPKLSALLHVLEQVRDR